MMKRFEIYLDNDNRLSIDVYKKIKSEYEYKKFKGRNCYNIIKQLASNDVLTVDEDLKDDNITLSYKNYIVTLNEYKYLLNKLGMKPLVLNVKDFYEKESIKKVKNKKVVRKNKYTKRKVIAAGLAAIVIGTVGIPNLRKVLNNSVNLIFNSSNDYKADDYKTIKAVILTDEQETNDNKIIKTSKTMDQKVNYITINYEDRSNTNKANKARNNYGTVVDKYANMYGLDPKLVMAIATQERGEHSPVMDKGGATGLMQIQNSVWVGQTISAYNFSTNKVDSFKVTSSMLSDLNTNIMLGCMVLQNNLKSMNYNQLAAIQCYNMGYGNMQKILNCYSKATGRDKNSILNDTEDIGWLDYRSLIKVGDQKYLEHVLSWYGPDCNITSISDTGAKFCVNVSNNIQKKVY